MFVYGSYLKVISKLTHELTPLCMLRSQIISTFISQNVKNILKVIFFGVLPYFNVKNILKVIFFGVLPYFNRYKMPLNATHLV